MDTKERDHLLSLRVMRLTRPTIFSVVGISNEARDLPGDLFMSELRADPASCFGVEMLPTGPQLLLPQSFGDIYLGETFSCYISLHNDSNEAAVDVQLKVELQTASSRQSLTGPEPTNVGPGENYDRVINHEVKESGVHMLVCAVNYVTENSEKLQFRKLFKFQVQKPLDVKTKFYNAESDKVFLEAQVQNLTTGPMCIEKVSLEPSQLFTVESLNTIAADDDGNTSLFGKVNSLKAGDTMQYLYCLVPVPAPPNVSGVTSSTHIGRLDIVWRCGLGEKGRLQTSPLQRMTPVYGDVRLTVEELPNLVTLDHTFTLIVKLQNQSERSMELVVELEQPKGPRGLLWEGLSGFTIPPLPSRESTTVKLSLLPLQPGLQTISGCRVIDTFLRRTYEYDDLAQVFVMNEQAVSA